jgi:hypothetical protein
MEDYKIRLNIMYLIKKLKKFYLRRFASCEDYARFIGVIIGKNCSIATRNFSSEPYLIEIANNCRIEKKENFYSRWTICIFKRKFT